MKLGIFGGTFNPPHLTHADIAEAAIEQLGLDKLLAVPCGFPPHKLCEVDKDTRLMLTKLAFKGICQVWDYEIRKNGASYTYETLLEAKRLYKDAELYLIIGGDSLKSFGKWYKPDEIAKLCVLAVADRNRKTSDASLSRVERRYGAKVVRLNLNPVDVSSTEIRLRYTFGMDNSQYVSEAVNRFVLDNGLYRKYGDTVNKLREYLTEQRFLHTFYVVKRGLQLAREEEKDKVFLACLLHDCAKYVSPSDYEKYGFVKPPDMPLPVVHSFLGASVAKRDFGVNDEEILNAVAYHTTGRPNMTRLEKIVYVADKTEETRPYPLSHLLKGSLDNMFVKCLAEANEYTSEVHGDGIFPLTEQTLEYYINGYKRTESNKT
ncbi:MAG: nicotinate (nicotinamide) nucleotide adenylyltransferase [Corallococcus sp.]|nr:nicotinate (nicotinamide) nucleotide adenylyltransferase [Corallococcus sp.]